MTKYTLLAALLAGVLPFLCTGQTSELKYKDVYEVVRTQPQEKAFEFLLSFQKQDPYHANTYYHLGIIAQQWAKKYDPLTDYNNLSYFTYHANLYYDLAKKYLDEKESKKNWEYYHYVKPPEGEKKVSHQQILQDLEQRIAETKDFDKNINDIRKNYFGIVRNYNNSLSVFKGIVDKNNQLKDIYLTANPALIADINSIGARFDSTLFYFDRYKKAIASFPIMNYHQDFNKVDVAIYRLDGLTKSNFLKNNIDLWDFRKWTDTVLSVIENDIAELRLDIKREGKKIESLTDLMQLTKSYSDQYDYYTFDDKLAFRMGRFDFQPLILDLFTYKTNKLNLIIASKKPFNNPANIGDSTLNLQQKLWFYRMLNQKTALAGKQLETTKSHVSAFNVLKYSDYILPNYKDEAGLTNYLNNESKLIKTMLDESMEVLKQNIVAEKQHRYSNTHKTVSKKEDIALSQLESSLSGDKMNYKYTAETAIDSKGNIYITGYSHSDKNTQAFVAKCDSMYALAWIKTFDLSPNKKQLVNNYGSLIQTTDEGCIAILHTRDTSQNPLAIKNWLVRMDASGNEMYKDTLGPKGVPRLFVFDEINEKMVVAYKGNQLNEVSASIDTLLFEFADSAGRSIWKTPFILNGNLVNIIKSNENILVAGNFSALEQDGKMYNAQGGGTNSFMAVIGNQGKITHLKTYLEPGSYYLTHALKLDSETINLLGFRTTETRLNEVQKDSEIKLFYLLVDTEGKVTYKY